MEPLCRGPHAKRRSKDESVRLVPSDDYPHCFCEHAMTYAIDGVRSNDEKSTEYPNMHPSLLNFMCDLTEELEEGDLSLMKEDTKSSVAGKGVRPAPAVGKGGGKAQKRAEEKTREIGLQVSPMTLRRLRSRVPYELRCPTLRRWVLRIRCATWLLL